MQIKRQVKIAALVTVVAIAAACDHQRDLWVHGSAQLVVEGDWVPSLNQADMTGRATSRLYKNGGDVVSTDFFDTPRQVKYRMPEAGLYDALIMNGLILSDELTNLNAISLRNANRLETLEAVVKRVESLPDMVYGEDEYLASRDMEILTSASGQIEAENGGGYRIKYKNGVEQPLDAQNDGEVVLSLTPRPVSWQARVVVNLIKAGSMASAAGALKGFAGSAFLASGRASHMRVTHQLPLGDIVLDPTSPPDRLIGTIVSPLFVTFGPPTDLAAADGDWLFRFELSVTLRDGSSFEGVYDISQQLAPAIEKLRAGLWYDPVLRPITIEIGPVELPDVESSVNLNPWEDSDEITKIPVTN